MTRTLTVTVDGAMVPIRGDGRRPRWRWRRRATTEPDVLVLSPVGMDERTRARLRDLATLGDLLQPLDALGDQRVASDLSRAVEAAASRLVPRHVTVRVHGGDPDARAPVGERRAGRRSGAAATGR